MTPPLTGSAEQNIPLGIFLRIATATFLALMAATVKYGAARGIHPVELLFWRFAFALPVLTAWIAFKPGLRVIKTKRPFAHLWRSALGLCAISLGYWSLILLPLAEATAISFAAPLFATMLAALLLADQVGWHRWGAVLLGFVGVVIVMQPASSALPAAGLAIAIGAAFCVAGVHITLRQIGRTERSETTVFWFTALSALALGCILPFFAHDHGWQDWAIMAMLAFFGGSAQMLLTMSLRVAPVSAVAPFDYTQLVWAVVLGWMIFDAVPPAATWIGAAIIVCAGLYVLVRERRATLRERTSGD